MYTLSLHNGGAQCVRQAHNNRDYMPHNADPDRTSSNIVLRHIPVRDAYDRLFGDAVAAYNAKVSARRNYDRIIKDYYTQIDQDAKKHTAYELVVQLGGAQDGGAPDRAVDALQAYCKGWRQANPNLVCIGAYIHVDESTPHLHLDYIPVAKCNRGMHQQNSLTGALKAQGYVTHGTTDTAQMQWEQSERNRMRDICKHMGIDLHDQGVGRKRHLSVPEYKAVQDSIHAARDMLADTIADQVTVDLQLDAAKHHLAASEQQLDKLRRACDTRTDMVDMLDSECKSKQAEIANLDGQLAVLRASVAEQQGHADRLQDMIATRQPAAVDLYNQIARYREQIKNLDRDISDMQTRLDDLQELYNANNGDYVCQLDAAWQYLCDIDPDYATNIWDAAVPAVQQTEISR